MCFKFKYLIGCLVLATLFGCSKEDTVVKSSYGSHLDIRVAVGSRQSRALVDAFQTGDKVGLFVVSDKASDYTGSAYKNVVATAVVDGGATSWNLVQEVNLTDDGAGVYAYYPYNKDVTDYTAIPVDATLQTDYLYGVSSTEVSAMQPNADIVMHHALSAVRVSLHRGSYTGDGVVSSVGVIGNVVARSGSLNAVDGSLSSLLDVGADISVPTTGATLDADAETEVIFVPVIASSGAELTVFADIDGVTYTYTHQVGSMLAGTVYNYNLVMDESGFTLADMTVGDWGYTASGYPVISIGGKMVTFSGNIENIAFNNRVNGDGSVTITAVPLEAGRVVEPIELSGGEPADCSQSMDDDTGIRTVTLSNITSDQNLVFSGAWYPVYIEGDMAGMTISRRRAADGTVTITATPEDDDDAVKEAVGVGVATFTQTVDETTNIRTFTVSAQASPYTIKLNGLSSIWLVATYNIAETGVQSVLSVHDFDISTVLDMKVDGVSVTPAVDCDFSTTGEHVVKYKLKYASIPDNIFYDVRSLIKIRFPEGITSIGKYAFGYCSGLTTIFIPNSVTSIGALAFWHCIGLTEIVSFATNSPSITYRTFEGISSGGTLKVPIGCISEYSSWLSTNEGYLGWYGWVCEEMDEFIPFECTALTIIADDVIGNNTYTNIHYSALCNGWDGYTGEWVNDYTITGTAKSGSFAQNQSTTDSRLVDVSFTFLGKTATTTITQSPYEATFYAVDLNNQWQVSSKANPDDSLYDGVYESFSNYNVNNSGAAMTIKVFGHTSFTVYIRSYAESNYDYVMASALDQSIDNSTSYSNTTLVKAHTRGSQSSGTDIGSYKAVTYDIPDDGMEHSITVVYRKDSSTHKNDDKGYLLIAKP